MIQRISRFYRSANQIKMRIGGRDGVQCMKAMLDWSSCPRCALRYVGIDDEPLYKKTPREIHAHICEMAEKISGADTSKPKVEINEYKENVCVACLGVLQEKFCSTAFVEQISSKVKEAGHDSKTFFVPVHFPVSMTVRYHSLWLCLQQLYPELYDEDMVQNIVTLKAAWRYINLEALSQSLGMKCDSESPLNVNVCFDHENSQKECNFLFDTFPDRFKRRKNCASDIFNKTNVQNALRKMSDETFRSNYQTPPRVLDTACHCDKIHCDHEAVYLAGRYNKYSRELSQTKWYIENERMTDGSVEEYMGLPIQRSFKADRFTFMASGREDVDVKMLGTGRPFVVEVSNPRVTQHSQDVVTQIEQEVNNSTKVVRVRHLQVVPKSATTAINEGAAEKIKCYSAVCWSRRALTQQELDAKLGGVTDLQVNQKTPIRVLQRRAPATRVKVVHSLRAQIIDDHHFLLYLNTQAGTYIKEFVHSDLGRTEPNVALLLGDTKCDILELNVEAVLLDWPTPIEGSTGTTEQNGETANTDNSSEPVK